YLVEPDQQPRKDYRHTPPPSVVNSSLGAVHDGHHTARCTCRQVLLRSRMEEVLIGATDPRQEGPPVTEGLAARAPKYHRAADAIRREIRDNTLAPGQRLPAETTLAERFRMSVPTIPQALARLRP